MLAGTGSAALKAAACLPAGATLEPCEACWRAKKTMSEPIFSAVYFYETFFLLFFASATRRAQSIQDHPPLIVVWLR
jgi:hypothetical protein